MRPEPSLGRLFSDSIGTCLATLLSFSVSISRASPRQNCRLQAGAHRCDRSPVHCGLGGTEAGRFRLPHGVALDGRGCLYVVDTMNARVQKFAAG
ncbi:MAG TPA: hypothetical protein VKD72_00310 [Gemmataceae bacterium]|nr:hypothetical protein [Gemmataceae bacterium]